MKVFKNILVSNLWATEERTFWLVVHSLHSSEVVYWRFRDQRVLLKIWHFGLMDGLKVIVAWLPRGYVLARFTSVVSVWFTRIFLSFVNNWIVTFSHFYLYKIYFSLLLFRFHWILRFRIWIKLFIVRHAWLFLKEFWRHWHHYDSFFLWNSH